MTPCASPCASIASMGPPLEHGGMSWTKEVLTAAWLLQWGRRLNTAECAGAAHVANERGEASMGPPLEHGGMSRRAQGHSSLVILGLQWGRRLNTAECCGHRNGKALPIPASMGPPLEHGGMGPVRRRPLVTWRWLQWGRRLNTAEWRGSSLLPTLTVAGLQWGRRLNTAEWRRRGFSDLERENASMGPPLEHGGMRQYSSGTRS